MKSIKTVSLAYLHSFYCRVNLPVFLWEHILKWFLSLFSISLYNLCPCAIFLLPLLFPPVFIWLTSWMQTLSAYVNLSCKHQAAFVSFFNSRCHLLSLPPGTPFPLCVPFNPMQSHITPLVLWLLRSALLYHDSSAQLRDIISTHFPLTIGLLWHLWKFMLIQFLHS